MGEVEKAISAIVAAIIGVAIVAVLVSKNSNTAGVVSSFAQGFSGILNVAVSPVTGSAAQVSFGSASGGVLTPTYGSATGGLTTPGASGGVNYGQVGQLAGGAFGGLLGSIGGSGGSASSAGSAFDGAGGSLDPGTFSSVAGLAGGGSAFDLAGV